MAEPLLFIGNNDPALYVQSAHYAGPLLPGPHGTQIHGQCEALVMADAPWLGAPQDWEKGQPLIEVDARGKFHFNTDIPLNSPIGTFNRHNGKYGSADGQHDHAAIFRGWVKADGSAFDPQADRPEQITGMKVVQQIPEGYKTFRPQLPEEVVMHLNGGYLDNAVAFSTIADNGKAPAGKGIMPASARSLPEPITPLSHPKTAPAALALHTAPVEPLRTHEKGSIGKPLAPVRIEDGRHDKDTAEPRQVPDMASMVKDVHLALSHVHAKEHESFTYPPVPASVLAAQAKVQAAQVTLEHLSKLASEPLPTTLPLMNQHTDNDRKHVQKVQERLTALGYDLGSSGADGDLGPKTTAALETFQTLHHKVATGAVDKITIASINKSIGYEQQHPGYARTQLQAMEQANHIQGNGHFADGKYGPLFDPALHVRCSSAFGERPNQHGGPGCEFMDGYDFAAPLNTDILAVAKGKVKSVGMDSGPMQGGMTVIVELDDGNRMVICHVNKDVPVKEGDIVNKGDVIAKVGDTGLIHGVHAYVKITGPGANPIDYAGMMPAAYQATMQVQKEVAAREVQEIQIAAAARDTNANMASAQRGAVEVAEAPPTSGLQNTGSHRRTQLASK